MSENFRPSDNLPSSQEAIEIAEAFLRRQRLVLASDAPHAVAEAHTLVNENKDREEQNKRIHEYFIRGLGEPVYDYGSNGDGIVVKDGDLEIFKRGLGGSHAPSVEPGRLGFTQKFNHPDFPKSEVMLLSTKREKPIKGGEETPAYVVLEGITVQQPLELVGFPDYKGWTGKIIRAYMLGNDGNTTVTDRVVVTDDLHRDHVLSANMVEKPEIPENLWQNLNERFQPKPMKFPNPVQIIKNLVKR